MSGIAATRLRTPLRDDRPGMRWWWQSPVPVEELLRELRVIAAAGFGEVEIAFSPGFWADETQRAALAAVLEEAGRLDVGVAMTMGAAWPLQTPNTAAGTAHAAQELQYGVHHLAAGEHGSIAVPAPFDDPDRTRPARLVAVTAARVVERGPLPSVETVRDATGRPRLAIVNPDRSTVLDPASVLDLSDLADRERVTWSGRDGEWAIFGFWSRDSEQGVTSFLDRGAALAATRYLDEHQIGDANLARLPLAGTDLFEDSLELNADSLFWSPDLLERFTTRHGYDLVPHLPVLFAHGMCRYWVPNEEPVADFEHEDGSSRRIRRDYERLLTDLYVADHLLVLQEWAAGHGLRHKAQVAYGQNLEPVRSNRELARAGGRPEGESLNSGDRFPVRRDHPNWRFALDWQRSIVGGAHQGGATRVSTELGAQFLSTYAITLGDYQQLLDKEWAAGITRPFVHGFASQEPDAPWPTQCRFKDYVAVSWNDTRFPEWVNWRGLTDYWARGTIVLEAGTPRTDLAIHREGFLTTAARVTPAADATAPERLADTEALERMGCSIQYVDPLGLSEPGAVGGDDTLFPEGPAYRGLVLDERELLPEAAEAIDLAASRGLKVVVVGEPPSASSSFVGGDAAHERVRSAVQRLLGRPSVAQVQEMANAADAFRSLGLVPRAAFDDAALLTQWRDAGSHQYLVVYNTEADDVSATLSLEGTGAVHELDLRLGGRSPLPVATDGGRTALHVALPPLGLRVYELEIGARTHSPSASDERTPLRELSLGPWRVEVTTEEPGPSRRIDLDQGPADWREVEDLRGVSGVARYRTTVTVGSAHTFVVELGALAGSAVVRAGGEEFGPVYTSGATLELGSALADGALEIEVRTALHNAVASSGLRPNVGVGLQLRGLDPSTLEPHGLIGPVRVWGR